MALPAVSNISAVVIAKIFVSLFIIISPFQKLISLNTKMNLNMPLNPGPVSVAAKQP